MDEDDKTGQRIAEIFATAVLTRLGSDDLFQRGFLSGADDEELVIIHGAILGSRPLEQAVAAGLLGGFRLMTHPGIHDELAARLQPNYIVRGPGACELADVFAAVGIKAGFKTYLEMLLPAAARGINESLARDAPAFTNLCRSLPRVQ